MAYFNIHTSTGKLFLLETKGFDNTVILTLGANTNCTHLIKKEFFQDQKFRKHGLIQFKKLFKLGSNEEAIELANEIELRLLLEKNLSLRVQQLLKNIHKEAIEDGCSPEGISSIINEVNDKLNALTLEKE